MFELSRNPHAHLKFPSCSGSGGTSVCFQKVSQDKTIQAYGTREESATDDCLILISFRTGAAILLELYVSGFIHLS